MKKVYYLLFGIILTFSAMSAIIYNNQQPKALESITFFPIDPKVSFTAFDTSLKPLKKNIVLWQIKSNLDRHAYLRQDAGMLYSNGRLIGRLGGWKQHTASLTQEKRVPVTASSFLQAFTFHHAELHERGGQIFSAQAMSQDHLYLIKQNADNFISFRSPNTTNQSSWKDRLDEQTERMLRYSWNKAVRHYAIHLKDYQAYPLNEFSQKASDTFPGFTKDETAKMIGRLWEGLYKNYFLSITKQDGSKADPTGSTIPLILLAKDKTHLLVLTETVKGESILLRQMIGDAD
ncbi:hypothetical protein [Neobacillus kokaensis]|uniref:Uncharacterized protein n=1 Tax=Neobacillus kokaensis TaxID=2759023 RepID=A0ABQ3MYL1_9BACI|nr:hypothetical protein [Neobacillus kokaensis]GHH96991.1 hypothetical protein AM1BK_05340 [Neobacillus kokaensis]